MNGAGRRWLLGVVNEQVSIRCLLVLVFLVFLVFLVLLVLLVVVLV